MKVLFVGNSHTYVNDMPQIFKLNSNKDVDVQMLARPGITFEIHLNDPSLYFALKQDSDIVIYQQAAHKPCPSKDVTLSDGKKLIELARKHHKDVYVIKPWPVRGDKEGYDNICDIYSSLQKENNVTIIDVGEAIVRIDEKWNCYLKDNEHLNPLGSYIEACSVLKAVFNQSSFKGLTLDMYNEVPFDPMMITSEQKEYVEKVLQEL